MLETVERFEEDLTDHSRVHGPLRVVIQVGVALEVDPVRERASGADPLMVRLRAQLEGMLDRPAPGSNHLGSQPAQNAQLATPVEE